MRFLVHGVLGLGLVLATTGVASATKCTDQAAVATARGTADARCGGCANASNHGHYVSCVAKKATDLADSGDLPKECKGQVVRCAAKSTCGKPGFITCCRVDKKGKVKCSIKSSLDRCKAPKGGQACAGGAASCCDSCGAGSPEGAFVCGTTTTSTAPTTTSTAPPTTSTTPTTTSTTTSTTTTTMGSPSSAFLEDAANVLD